MLTVVTGTPSALSRGRMMPPEKRTSEGLSRSSTGTVSSDVSLSPVGSRQALFQGDVVGLVEVQARQAEPVVDDMGGDAGLGIDGEVIFVVRAARSIEVAGEDQAGFGLRLGGVDLQTAKDKVGRLRDLCRRQGAGDGRESVLQSGEKVVAGLLRSSSAQDVKRRDDDRDDGDDAAGDHEIVPIVTAHVGPPHAKSLTLCFLHSNSRLTKLSVDQGGMLTNSRRIRRTAKNIFRFSLSSDNRRDER